MFDDRPIRAGVVQQDVMSGRLLLHVGYRLAPGVTRCITAIGELEQEETVESGTLGPTLAIREDVARALLDALTKHYGGSTSTEQLRKDYDAERARVDKLITFAITPPTVEYRTESR